MGRRTLSENIERLNDRPDYLAHVILPLGVLLFAFPVWLVFAGSTQDSDAIMRGELSLVPDLANLSVYPRVLLHGTMGTQPVWHMLLVSFGMASPSPPARSSSRSCPPTPSYSSAFRSAGPRSG